MSDETPTGPSRAPVSVNRQIEFAHRRIHEEITETPFGDKHTVRDVEINSTEIGETRTGDKFDLLALPDDTIADNVLEHRKHTDDEV